MDRAVPLESFDGETVIGFGYTWGAIERNQPVPPFRSAAKDVFTLVPRGV